MYRSSIRYPRRVVVLAVLITLIIAPGALRLKLRTDGHALVPPAAPAVVYDQAIRAEFGIEDPIVIVIRTEHPDGIFNTDTLGLVQDLTADFGRIEGVRAVNLFSLATERNNRVRPGTLKFRTFLEPLPTKPEELRRLQGDLERIRLYSGTLVSHDLMGTLILVGAPTGVNRTRFYQTIQDVVATRRPILDEVHVIGAPVAEALLGTHILQDLGVPAQLLGARVDVGDEARAWQMPRTLDELRLFVGRHIGLVPIAIAVMVIVFLAAFRSVAAALLPTTEVVACLAVVFGLMGWFGVPVYLTIAVLPVILTAIGVADEIHICSCYLHELRGRPHENHVNAVTTAMNEMWVPVVKTSVTTAVGFLSFALSPIEPVRAFGIFTAVGIVFCMLWSLTVIPALLVLIPARRFVADHHRPAEKAGAPRAAVLTRVARVVIGRRHVVLGITLVVVGLAPFGLRRLVVQDSWIDGFAASSVFHRATRMFDEKFLGMHILLVSVDTGDIAINGKLDPEVDDRYPLRLPGDLVEDPEVLVGWHVRLRPSGGAAFPAQTAPRGGRAREWNSWIETAVRDGDQIVVTTTRKYASLRRQFRLSPNEQVIYEIAPRRLATPDVLQRIAELEDFIGARSDCSVGGVIGTADYVETTNFMARGNKEQHRRIPATREQVAWAWDKYERIRGADHLRQVVSADYSRSLITVFLKNANFVDTAHLMTAIREYERSHLAGDGITLGFAGDVAVSQTLIGAIVSTQTRSLLMSLVGVLVVTSLLARSLHWGSVCVLPCALAVLINFAVMGWTGLPLGVATSMFTGMTLGIGVDFAIHLSERYRLTLSRGATEPDALIDAVTVAGPAIIIDALGIALGFGVMMLSQVPANARLGALVVLSIVNCLAGTLLVLPALLRLWPPRRRLVSSRSTP